MSDPRPPSREGELFEAYITVSQKRVKKVLISLRVNYLHKLILHHGRGQPSPRKGVK